MIMSINVQCELRIYGLRVISYQLSVISYLQWFPKPHADLVNVSWRKEKKNG